MSAFKLSKEDDKGHCAVWEKIVKRVAAALRSGDRGENICIQLKIDFEKKQQDLE